MEKALSSNVISYKDFSRQKSEKCKKGGGGIQQKKTVLLPSSSSRTLTKSESTGLGALVECDVSSWQSQGKAFRKVIEKLIVCQYLGS